MPVCCGCVGINIHELCQGSNSWIPFILRLNEMSSLSGTDEDAFDIVAMLLWSLREARNALVFEGQNREAAACLDRAMSLLKEFKKATASSNGLLKDHSKAETAEGWRPPPPGCIKVNVDAAFKNEVAGPEFWRETQMELSLWLPLSSCLMLKAPSMQKYLF
jgi:hypothetical protein